MKKYLCILVLSMLALVGCEKRTSLSTYDLPDKDNLLKHSKMLNAKEAPEDMSLLSTSKPSIVSPNIAITKMLNSLTSYNSDSDFAYNTTYTINRVNEVIVRGRKYYAGLCEFDFRKRNGSDIIELDGVIPCISIVDAEDINAPALLRVSDSMGNPYEIKLHLESFVNGRLDNEHIVRHLHNAGYDNIADMNNDISKPNIEFDENWRPYFSSMWLKDDAAMEYGTAYYPLAYVLTDMQTGETTGYSIDNPITTDVDEGKEKRKETSKLFSEIPKWVDRVYSKRLFIQMATHAGYPIENYGKRAYKGQLILDGTRVNDSVEVCQYTSECKANNNQVVETSKSKDGKDIIMTAYYTSRSNDLGVNKIIQFNARTGEAYLFDRKGTEKAMTVKTSVIETIINASLMKNSYDVEDVTLNPIFGRLTWHTVITRNLHDNEGNNTTTKGTTSDFYSEEDLSYSVYAMTCLIEATNSINISDIVCDSDEEVLYNKYRNHIYKKDSKYNRSTVLLDTEKEGVLTSKIVFDNYVIIELDNEDIQYIVEIDNIFNKELGSALTIKEGDKVFIKFGDQINLDKKPVRFIKKLKK